MPASRPSVEPSAAPSAEGVEQPVSLAAYPVEAWFAFVVFWALAVVAFLQFSARYVVSASLPWSEEVARHLLVVLAFLASAVAVRQRSHVAVSVLHMVLPKLGSRIVTTVADLLQILFYASCAYLMVRVAMLLSPQRMASLNVSIGLLYGIVAVSFMAMTLRACGVAVENWRAPPGPGVPLAKGHGL